MVLCQCYYLKKSSTKEILVDGIKIGIKILDFL